MKYYIVSGGSLLQAFDIKPLAVGDHRQSLWSYINMHAPINRCVALNRMVYSTCFCVRVLRNSREKTSRSVDCNDEYIQ